MILTTCVLWDLTESKAQKKRPFRADFFYCSSHWKTMGPAPVELRKRDLGWEAAFPSASHGRASAFHLSFNESEGNWHWTGVHWLYWCIRGSLLIRLLSISCSFSFFIDFHEDEQAWGYQATGDSYWTLALGGLFLLCPVDPHSLPKSHIGSLYKSLWNTKTQVNCLNSSFLCKLEQRGKTKTLTSKPCGLYAKILRQQGLWPEKLLFPHGPSKTG